jgi:hypothetical protein
MIPDFNVFRNGVDLSSVAIPEEHQLKNIISSSLTFPRDFPSHGMSGSGTFEKSKTD